MTEGQIYFEDVETGMALPPLHKTPSNTLLFLYWVGEEGTLKKLSYANRDIAYVNERLICKGAVTRKWVEGGKGYVECEVWVENAQGAQLTPGSATVILPRKSPKSKV